MRELIDYKDAVDTIRKIPRIYVDHVDPEDVLHALRFLPRVTDQFHKEGNWELLDAAEDIDESINYIIFACSECSFLTDIKFKYCPGCGADMRGD